MACPAFFLCARPGMCAIFARDRLDHRPGCTPSSPDTEPILSDLSVDVCKCNFMENERGRSEVTKKIRTFAEIILDL